MTPVIVLLALILAAALLAPGALVALVKAKAPSLLEAPQQLAEHLAEPALDLEQLAEAIAERMPAPAPAGDMLDDLIKHRYVVTLGAAEGNFAGVMTDLRVIETQGEPLLVYTFEQCSTLPETDGDTPREIAGRVIIDSSDIAYLQQIG